MSPETSEIVRSLGRIEGKLDGILRSQIEMKTEATALRADLDKVKAKLHWYSGGLAALSFVLVFLKDKLQGVFA